MKKIKKMNITELTSVNDIAILLYAHLIRQVGISKARNIVLLATNDLVNGIREDKEKEDE